MPKYNIPKHFSLIDVPEFQRFQKANSGKEIDEVQTAIMYGRAIHWLAIFDIIWPEFEKINYFSVEVKSIIFNDPDRLDLPIEFYRQIAEMLSMFWRIRLEDLYPNEEWTVKIHNDSEMTVDAVINRKS